MRRGLAIRAVSRRHRHKYISRHIRKLLEGKAPTVDGNGAQVWNKRSLRGIEALGGAVRLEACRLHMLSVYGSVDEFVQVAWPRVEMVGAHMFGGDEEICQLWPLRVRLMMVKFLRGYEPSGCDSCGRVHAGGVDCVHFPFVAAAAVLAAGGGGIPFVAAAAVVAAAGGGTPQVAEHGVPQVSSLLELHALGALTDTELADAERAVAVEEGRACPSCRWGHGLGLACPQDDGL